MTIGAFFIFWFIITTWFTMIEIRHAAIVDSSNSQFAYDNLYSEGELTFQILITCGCWKK